MRNALEKIDPFTREHLLVQMTLHPLPAVRLAAVSLLQDFANALCVPWALAHLADDTNDHIRAAARQVHMRARSR